MSLLIDILQPAPVSSIDEVLSIMTAIERRLPDSDGLKWFNRLYLRVTQSVRLAVAGRAFRDARFMSELDVVFANLCFAALGGRATASRRILRQTRRADRGCGKGPARSEVDRRSLNDTGIRSSSSARSSGG